LFAARPGDTEKPPALTKSFDPKDDNLSGSDNRKPALEIPLFCGCKGREIDQRCDTDESAGDRADISGLAICTSQPDRSILSLIELLLLYFLCFLVHVVQKLTDPSLESPPARKPSPGSAIGRIPPWVAPISAPVSTTP
jgi:hypothetical protein